MRILLDECVHAGVRAAFLGHAVRTVADVGLSGSHHAALLAFAERSFDVFVTIDRKLEHQHNLKKLKLGVIMVRVRDNKLGSYKPLFGKLKVAAEKVKAGQVIHVPSVQR